MVSKARILVAALLMLVLSGAVVLTPGAAVAGDHDALLKKADAIAAKVATLRGLAQKRPIKRGVMQKDQIRARLLERIDQEYSATELAAEELVMKRLGLLPADADYKQLVIELLTNQIAGFYDPADRQLYIAGWQESGIAAMGADMLMAHEIVHALQDQHFDLRAFMKPDKRNSDASVARQALVEGDGTALMLEYVLSDMGMPAPWADENLVSTMGAQMSGAVAGELGQAPVVLREGLIFPYLKGLAFIAHFRKLNPWSRVDAIYKKPPLSTEHILHPEKYESYERPIEISITGRALRSLPGHTAIYDNVIGELGLTVFLRQHTDQAGQKGQNDKTDKTAAALLARAERATSGWGGDRLLLLSPSGADKARVDQTVGVSMSVWDQPADAIELIELLADSMASLSGSGGKAVAGKQTADYIEFAGSAGQVFIAQRRDAQVVLILGAPADRAQAMLAEVWTSWKIKRR